MQNKNKIRKNSQRFKSDSQLLSKLSLLQKQLHLLIHKSKQNYYSRMHCNICKPCMLQETLITFPVLKLDTTSSKTLSFLLQ